MKITVLIITAFIGLFISVFYAQSEFNQIDSNGLKQGKWVEYYPDTGILKEEMEYLNDTLNGDTKIYYESGEVQAKFEFISGIKIYQESFEKSGKISIRYIYIPSSNFEYFCKYDEEGAIRYQRFSIRDNDGKMIHYEIAISDKGNVSETGGSHFVKCFYPHFLTE